MSRSGLPIHETQELRFVGGPMDGHMERFPARPTGEHAVTFPVPEPFTASMYAEGYVPPPFARRVNYREKCRWARGHDTLYVEMEFAP